MAQEMVTGHTFIVNLVHQSLPPTMPLELQKPQRLSLITTYTICVLMLVQRIVPSNISKITQQGIVATMELTHAQVYSTL